MKKVLVIDDDEAMRALLRVHLSNAGYEVLLAEDAVIGGRMLLRAAPDFLIVDAELPYLNGVEFVATILADGTLPALPMLFITAHEHYRDRFEGLGVGYLMKPFTVDALLKAVNEVLKPL